MTGRLLVQPSDRVSQCKYSLLQGLLVRQSATWPHAYFMRVPCPLPPYTPHTQLQGPV